MGAYYWWWPDQNLYPLSKGQQASSNQSRSIVNKLQTKTKDLSVLPVIVGTVVRKVFCFLLRDSVAKCHLTAISLENEGATFSCANHLGTNFGERV
jgi:hypothetical protein